MILNHKQNIINSVQFFSTLILFTEIYSWRITTNYSDNVDDFKIAWCVSLTYPVFTTGIVLKKAPNSVKMAPEMDKRELFCKRAIKMQMKLWSVKECVKTVLVLIAKNIKLLYN